MPLLAGSRLGPYEILAPLGAGGMGEVYKCRDPRLNRIVAIKVLPAERLGDQERKQRFIQEAQAASALNHPSIIGIYDIASDYGRDYIVMEYVAGKTIDALIPRTGMRLGELLKIAIQVADGVSVAHDAGIVHRDLKPSNIIVSESGMVKILDFGLAKLTERGSGSEDSLTRSLQAKTAEGTVLGTAAYMSPEQAEGKPLDVRSDIFSFGAVLYEMATGQRAFPGDSQASILAGVLTKEPRPARDVSPAVPIELDKIITRCLRKDTERRAQHMGDIKLALQDLKEDSESGKLSAAVPGAVAARPLGPLAPSARRDRSRRGWFDRRGRCGSEAVEKAFRPGSLRVGANHESAGFRRSAGALAGWPHAYLHSRPLDLCYARASLREDAAQRRAGAAHAR